MSRVVLINILSSASTTDIHQCETVGMGAGSVDRDCGDGYSVHRDGRGWCSVSFPAQTSSCDLVLHNIAQRSINKTSWIGQGSRNLFVCA